MRSWLAMIVAGLAVLSFSSARAGCLSYTKPVELTGTISERVDPGPPGYGEDPKHDAKEPHLYLALDKPACVDGTPSDDLNVSERNQLQMQMLYMPNKHPFNEAWRGKHAAVTGKLFHGSTGHHWTSILIDVTDTRVITAAP